MGGLTALDAHGSHWNNLVIHPRRTVLFLPCKSAQTSIKAAVADDYGFATPDVIEAAFSGYRLVAVFRNPWSRLASGWRDKGAARFGTFPDFVDWLLSHPCPRRVNQHYRPQCENWTNDSGQMLAIRHVIRVEHLAADWHRVWGGDIGHLNRSEGAGPAELKAQLRGRQSQGLRRFYQADFRFWGAICRGYGLPTDLSGKR